MSQHFASGGQSTGDSALWCLLCHLPGKKLIPESYFLVFQLLSCPSVDANLKVPFFMIIYWPMGKPLPIGVPETNQ